MPSFYPASIQALVEQFTKFPGIGEKTAQRFVFFLLRASPQELAKFAKCVMNLQDSLTICALCRNYAESHLCLLCSNQSRDHATICVVAYSHEMAAIEKTSEYKGVYHILGGNLNILEGVTPDKLAIKELLERIKEPQKKIQEVILAFNPDLEGESTGLYLSKLLRPYSLKITRLARGLPRGADIEYADEITLGDALKSRREM